MLSETVDRPRSQFVANGHNISYVYILSPIKNYADVIRQPRLVRKAPSHGDY